MKKITQAILFVMFAFIGTSCYGEDEKIDTNTLTSNLPILIYDSTTALQMFKHAQEIIDTTKIIVPAGSRPIKLIDIVKETLRNNHELNLGLKKLNKDQQTKLTTEKIRDAHIAYWELVYARVKLAIRQQSLALGVDILRENMIRYKYRDLITIDLYEAQVAVKFRDIQVVEAQLDLDNAMDVLRKIVSIDRDRPDWEVPLVPIDPPRFVDVDIDETLSLKFALEYDPYVKKARIEEIRSNHLPIKVRAAKNEEDRVIYAIRKCVRSIENLKRRVLCAKELVEAKRAYLRKQEISHNQGVTTSVDLLNTQSEYSQAQLYEIRTVIDYFLAHVKLECVQGTIIFSQGINWKLYHPFIPDNELMKKN